MNRRRTIPNSDLAVSPLCYGVMKFGTVAQGDDMFKLYEQYCESGGNFFDTAHSYACWRPNGGGASERGLGDCLRKFGNREDVVIVTKGGHHGHETLYPRPDNCLAPEVLASDISDSLERLGIDTIDLYVLHRDHPANAPGDVIETLNAEIQKGRIRYIGASNWPIERIAEANAYAASRGLQGFVISSPQWNLAIPNQLPYFWTGEPDTKAVMMSEEDVEWHRRNGFATMPWTPTAYGYFAGADGRNPSNFDNPVSRARRERAERLAKELGASTNQVALAYLIAHEFPVFPILGTMNPEHLADALGAASLSLTAEQREWLKTGA